AELYAAFVQVVAEGRRRQASDIAALAQGRVWSGAHALEHGLVDVLGGFDQALREVRLELGPGAERLAPRLITPRRVGPPSAPLPRWVAALAEQAPKSLLEPALLGLTASSEPVWRWSAVVEGLSGSRGFFAMAVGAVLRLPTARGAGGPNSFRDFPAILGAPLEKKRGRSSARLG